MRKPPPTLAERAEKYVKHSFYCRWRDGAYRDVPCTCGADAFMADLRSINDLKRPPGANPDGEGGVHDGH